MQEGKMPQNARVFIAEDVEIFRDNAKRSLKEAGHVVVAEASTFEEFLALRDKLPALNINVAILDNKLSQVGGEGELIASWLKRKIRGIKIIAYSSGPYDFGKISVRKGTEHLHELCEAVKNL